MFYLFEWYLIVFPCWFQRNEDSHAFDDEVSILDISSGFLSLASNSLVPDLIDKNFLENAKVLLQLDKKFIPVVSGGILAVIDQVSSIPIGSFTSGGFVFLFTFLSIVAGLSDLILGSGDPKGPATLLHGTM